MKKKYGEPLLCYSNKITGDIKMFGKQDMQKHDKAVNEKPQPMRPEIPIVNTGKDGTFKGKIDHAMESPRDKK